MLLRLLHLSCVKNGANNIATKGIFTYTTTFIKTDILRFDDLYNKYVFKKEKCSVSKETHPLHKCFPYMR